jgi:hypothetical protein
MSKLTKIKALGGMRTMSPQEFKEAKLLSLLSIVAMIHKDFFTLPKPDNCESEAQADAAAKHVTDMFFGLLQACHRFYRMPDELHADVQQFALSLGIQIDIELMPPSSIVPQ